MQFTVLMIAIVHTLCEYGNAVVGEEAALLSGMDMHFQHIRTESFMSLSTGESTWLSCTALYGGRVDLG